MLHSTALLLILRLMRERGIPGMLLGSFIMIKFKLKAIPVNIRQYFHKWKNQNWFSGKKYSGLVKRINKNIDELSQTVGVHIEFKNVNLKDGMYVRTKIPLNIKKAGFSISRSIHNDSFVYVAESDNTVGIRNVKIVYYDEDFNCFGLEDDSNLISSYIPGIYKGMKIKVAN